MTNQEIKRLRESYDRMFSGGGCGRWMDLVEPEEELIEFFRNG